jgi:putative iron-regulated protein
MNRSLISLLALAVGCTGDKDSGGLPAGAADAVATYAEIVEASYADSLSGAQSLAAALDALVAGPSDATMSTARTEWLASREPYLQTEVYRFYDGPIDNPTDGPEGLINAWPLDENYIDYVAGDDTAGIVNGTETIDAATLEGLNEAGGEANIATGYHAIEFLLWGQDESDTGPGARPWSDYATDGTGTAANQDRRGQYLTVAGDLLVTHIAGVHSQWESGSAYRTAFESDAELGMERILTGMIILSGFETGGERLQAALDSQDQEDEHSCFSDNTHRDMIQDVQGVQNVWLGSYTRTDGSVVSGTSVQSVVADLDSDLADRLTAKIAESLSVANAMQVPFDQEIAPGSDGNARVEALVVSLREQETILFEVFDLLGLSVEIPE